MESSVYSVHQESATLAQTITGTQEVGRSASEEEPYRPPTIYFIGAVATDTLGSRSMGNKDSINELKFLDHPPDP